jgi:hypothetical protein
MALSAMNYLLFIYNAYKVRRNVNRKYCLNHVYIGLALNNFLFDAKGISFKWFLYRTNILLLYMYQEKSMTINNNLNLLKRIVCERVIHLMVS